MIKYNITIGSLKDIDTSDLDCLLDEYDLRLLDIETKGKYDLYNYIISEEDIIPFLSCLSYDYFVKYIFDDILYQINKLKTKKYCDIYKNRFHFKIYDYKLIYTQTENEIFSLCKYIEKNYKY
jgi:hypothetical protein